MSAARLAAAVLSLLLLAGCAMLPAGMRPTTPATASTQPLPAVRDAGSRSLGVRIEIEAPADLKLLLERYLDLVRLGRIARDEVEDSEWSRLIDAAPAQVRELLLTEGFVAPKVMLQREPGRSAGQPDVVLLQVDPGQRARISRVTIDVEGALERDAQTGEEHARKTLEQLRARWALQAGSDFRNPLWTDAKTAALARLRAAGYASAVWSGTGAQIDVERNEVRLFLVVDSGPLFRFGGLVIDGLTVQDESTVMNLAATRPGTPVTETLLLDFQDRLQKSGLFESISVTLDTDPARADAARVQVRVGEAPLQVYTFGLGFSANTGARASVEHVYRRVFGFAATARNKGEWGQKRQAWDGEVSTHPNEALVRHLLGGAVERLVTDSDTVLSQRIRLGRAQDTQRIERLFFAEVERSQRDVATTRTQAVAASGNFHAVWRDLDSLLLPTRGVSLALQLGAGRSHGTNTDAGYFGRTYAKLTGYLPLGGQIYAQARLEAGQVFLADKDTVLPQSQLFRAGGDDSVRAYASRSLGPLTDGVVGGGKALLTTSFELATPISKALPSLWGAVFVDAGNAANDFKNFKAFTGTGVGVRWRSPVGPLRVDLAWSPETRQTRLHFSVGVTF
jgi:translocation and assembly module TamA